MRFSILLFCAILLALCSPIHAQETNADNPKTGLPELYKLSTAEVHIVIDSLSSTMTPRFDLIDDVKLYLRAMRMNQPEILVLIDSLFDAENLSAFLVHQLKQAFKAHAFTDSSHNTQPFNSSLIYNNIATTSTPGKIHHGSAKAHPGLDLTSFGNNSLGEQIFLETADYSSLRGRPNN